MSGIIRPSDFEILERILARVCDQEASDEQLEQMAEKLVALWNTGTRDEDALEQVLKAWFHNMAN
ncbi:hypothetical protein MesoLjLc_29600 [Mesorhizobium sp. L-8-10]|uniref:hypothetical protein n=1 Tax=Mesorhizobium sp. L-8-10 TaxID=2744523 RepID=UPI001926E388|nr:hypothetical protein [Mesorhizobium sp. L-8-10]BCH31030.1 hypothetical protein MesoLjLc_29600 [Mesorhizobium sp. L-8-10]